MTMSTADGLVVTHASQVQQFAERNNMSPHDALNLLINTALEHVAGWSRQGENMKGRYMVQFSPIPLRRPSKLAALPGLTEVAWWVTTANLSNLTKASAWLAAQNVFSEEKSEYIRHTMVPGETVRDQKNVIWRIVQAV